MSISKELGTPAMIRFHASDKNNPSLNRRSSPSVLKNLFKMESADELKYDRSFSHQKNAHVEKYERYYHGIKVEHGDYSVLTQNEQIQSIHAEHYLLENLDLNPALTEKQALEGALISLGAELYAWDATQQFLDTRNDLSASVRTALKKTMAEEYPKGELVIVKDYYGDRLRVDIAYRFIIEAVSPLFKDKVYVNAHDGRIMLRDAQIKHGTGETRYSGTRSFPTTQIDVDTFELAGLDDVSGIRLETRSLEGIGGLPLSVGAIYALSEAIRDGDADDPCATDGPLTAAETGDDSWLSVEHKKAPFEAAVFPNVSCCDNTYTPLPGSCTEVHNDDIALDAQWGAMIVARYWKSRHGRDSYDDNGADIFSFVHYGDAYDNAFWNGSGMTYGDGSYQNGTYPGGSFAPLTSLDVCGHEIGHAVCSSTSDLVYQRESGALNEGFSDIWAAAIERFAIDSIDNNLAYSIYGVGEQIDERDGGIPQGQPGAQALRWMDDPKAEGNPDTYGGVNWQNPECGEPTLANDYCGVHGNSGVLNKWYYLLTEGSGQTFSPGDSKAAADDEMNDLSEAYEVVGIGSIKAELIAFLGETMLLQNSTFADMRNASIDAARVLYGSCSFEEEQTTNAWHAVGVGDAFAPCASALDFANFNPSFTSEKATQIGCSAQKIVTLTMFSSGVNSTINLLTSGTATEGEDYMLNTSAITFSGTETKTIDIIIFDDRVVEMDETIIISFDDGTFSGSETLLLLNDDVAPVIGAMRETLVMEGFDVSTLPVGWSTTLINPESANEWLFNGGSAPGVAYVTLAGGPSPAYNSAADANIRLVSPLIDIRGRNNVEIEFDYQVGGEADAADGTLFDYGTFQISVDGGTWIDIENYVGDGGGNVPVSGTYSMSHPELTNKVFQLGFRWFNDALLGSAFSFTIDNVLVTAEGITIESEVGDADMADIPAVSEVFLISPNDGELLGRINSINNLGCTNIQILQNDLVNTMVEATECDHRSSKVIGVDVEEEELYKLTLYFTAAEVSGWANPEQLNVLAVKNIDIDNFDDGFEVIQNNDITINNQLAGGAEYISYTFETASSFISFALTNKVNSRFVMNTTNDALGSLRQLISDACSNDTIFFDNGIMDQIILLEGDEIILDKDVIIMGHGMEHLTISGENNSRIFNITNGSVVELYGMHLTNGVSDAKGGAILNKGETVLSGVSMKNNTDISGSNSIHNEGLLIIADDVKIEND
ncbi:hypothetical protein GCM10007940_41680 [Portibacter lacus]|uniref:M4 family peptidase n=2 Tax=Portibacter lacus TaxID=1099794 RepID=A0AA37SSY1_9BACT|nr:hypothetical protein GCM10007940_41680 [Portibacter lacus]